MMFYFSENNITNSFPVMLCLAIYADPAGTYKNVEDCEKKEKTISVH